MCMAVLTFSVPSEWDKKPVGEFLRRAHGVSGTTLKLAKRIPDGITQNGIHVRTVDPACAGAQIRLVVDGETHSYRPLFLDVPVLYEDGFFAAFDKPAGLASHPSRGHPYDTMANVYAARPQTAGLVYRPLGRLDRDTSGVLLAAKNAHAAYAARITEKRYLALLCGELPRVNGAIDAPIGREGEDTPRRTVRPDGQRAVTRWHVICAEKGFTLAELWLETGRTHQIRVHMAHLGCPLAGDALYGGRADLIERQALHCARLVFYHPMEEREISVSAPAARDFLRAMRKAFPGFHPDAEGIFP